MLAKQFGAACLGAVLVLCATTAEASLSLFLDDGAGTSFTVADNGVGDLNPLLGAIGFDNNVATKILPGFTTLNINSISNAPGSVLAALLNTTQLDVVAGAAKTLAMIVMDDAFTLPGVAGQTMLVANSIVANATLGSTAASATQVTELDNIPTPTASAAVVGTIGNLNDTDETSAFVVRGTPFTLETIVAATFAAGANVNFTHTSTAVAVVPEPMTVAIWSVLLGMGALMVHKRNRLIA